MLFSSQNPAVHDLAVKLESMASICPLGATSANEMMIHKEVFP